MKKIIGLTLAIVLILGIAAYAIAGGLPTVEKTDRFDVLEAKTELSMISRDGELVIHVGDNTEIIFEDGTEGRERLVDGQTITDLLDGRNLVVYYSITTRSLPPQTTPTRIVILYEIAVPPVYEFSPEEIEALFPLNGEIVVNGEVIDAPAPFYSNGVVMVPLRVIAELFGCNVYVFEGQVVVDIAGDMQ